MADGVVIVVAILGVVAVLLAIVVLYGQTYEKVDQGRALIINKPQRVEVSFTNALVLPIVHHAEVMDISVKTIEIARTGKEGLICQDNIRADIRCTFFVRVNPTTEDVLRVAKAVGAQRASHQETLEELFSAKFSEGMKIVGKTLDFEELYTRRHEFRNEIIAVIGMDLSGYILDDLAVDYLEMTPMTNLDPKNVLDAEGIKKITEITAAQAVQTHAIEREEQKTLRRLTVEAKEELIEQERHVANALAALEADTGRTLSPAQIEDRLVERLQQMVDEAVTQRLRSRNDA